MQRAYEVCVCVSAEGNGIARKFMFVRQFFEKIKRAYIDKFIYAKRSVVDNERKSDYRKNVLRIF